MQRKNMQNADVGADPNTNPNPNANPNTDPYSKLDPEPGLNHNLPINIH